MALIYDFEVDIAGAKLNNRIKDELRSLFRDNLAKAHSKSRISHQSLGVKTQRMRSLCMIAAIEILQNVGNFRFESLSALKEKHIHYLLEHWISKNHTRGTLENKITYLATLASWLGKANIVKSAEEYEQLKSLENRTGATEVGCKQ
ncbi:MULTISPECIES: phage integrase N-terminal domain-containing protein [unclassified Undibacterium]|uniref:phage integrase N-terminal domain-containing protein n=1 Tax=unclassified Undibacterium TaxID=2630295 RepID=UPI003C2E7528